MKTRRTAVLALLVAVTAVMGVIGTMAGRAAGDPKKAVARPVEEVDRELPPCVVSTFPANRARNVAFTIQEIKVTFDRRMKQGNSYSWIIETNVGLYPGYRSSPAPRWEDDGRTCVLPVKLSPDTLYAVGCNSYRHTGFRDETDKIAVPYVLVFKTAKAK